MQRQRESLSSEALFESREADIKIIRHLDESFDIALKHIHPVIERAEPGIHVSLKRGKTCIELGHNMIQLKDADHQRAQNRESRYPDRKIQLNVSHTFAPAPLL